MKQYQYIILIFLVLILVMCKTKEKKKIVVDYPPIKILTTQKTINEIIEFEKMINKDCEILEEKNISLSKSIFPIVNNYDIANPIIIKRKQTGFLPLSIEYYFSLPDSIIRFIGYDWEIDRYGNLFKKQQRLKDEGEKLNEYNIEYERIKKSLVNLIDKPNSEDYEPNKKELKSGTGHYFYRECIWENANYKAKLSLTFHPIAYRIRLNYYWKRWDYKYTGQEHDDETGLENYKARWYDSDGARFLMIDPMWGKYPSFSPYVYVGNNPLIYVDPDGNFPMTPGDLEKVGAIMREAEKRFFNYAGSMQGAHNNASPVSIPFVQLPHEDELRTPKIGEIIAVGGNINIIHAEGMDPKYPGSKISFSLLEDSKMNIWKITGVDKTNGKGNVLVKYYYITGKKAIGTVIEFSLNQEQFKKWAKEMNKHVKQGGGDDNYFDINYINDKHNEYWSKGIHSNPQLYNGSGTQIMSDW